MGVFYRYDYTEITKNIHPWCKANVGINMYIAVKTLRAKLDSQVPRPILWSDFQVGQGTWLE